MSSVKLIAASDSIGSSLKKSLVDYLRGVGVEVEDLGADGKYYAAAEEVARRVQEDRTAQAPGSPQETRGLLVCGTGTWMAIIANKFQGIYAATCNDVAAAQDARSINNANVVTLGAKLVPEELGRRIVDAFLATPFKSPSPANDSQGWPEDIQQFLDASMLEIPKIAGAASAGGKGASGQSASDCPVCVAHESLRFEAVDMMPGGSLHILRAEPTSAMVRFTAGSVEPAHHHQFGHDLVVLKGRTRVDNVSTGSSSTLGPGDFLYTPARQVHRVVYFEDTEFFIKWDGHWDIVLDETLEEARTHFGNTVVESAAVQQP